MCRVSRRRKEALRRCLEEFFKRAPIFLKLIGAWRPLRTVTLEMRVDLAEISRWKQRVKYLLYRYVVKLNP